MSRARRSSPSVLPRGYPFVVGERSGELYPAGDAGLPEHLTRVILDGAGAEEQPRADLPVGQVLGDQPGDLLLLRGEYRLGLGPARAGPLAGGAQLGPGPAGEGIHAHRVEHGEGGAQLVPGVAAAALAAQPLAVQEVGAGELGPAPGAAAPVHPLATVSLGCFSPSQQAPGARPDAQPPVGSARPGP